MRTAFIVSKINILLVVLIITATALTGQARAGDLPRFFEVLYDIPVMPGLTEIPDMAMVFDKPAGRIAQAGALGPGLTKAEIIDFYNDSLPQLGWRSQGEGTYLRDGEILRIEAQTAPSGPLVTLTLAPQSPVP